jgi:phage tail-like protein
MADPYHPPGAFYFSVTLQSKTNEQNSIDASFQEISGIQVEYDTEEVVEGGENRFAHRLPRYAKYSNLSLKRGVVTKDSFLGKWVEETLGSMLTEPVKTQDLQVKLLDASGKPLITWTFVKAWPVRWEIAPLDSLENKLLTETLEFSYRYFERT